MLHRYDKAGSAIYASRDRVPCGIRSVKGRWGPNGVVEALIPAPTIVSHNFKLRIDEHMQVIASKSARGAEGVVEALTPASTIVSHNFKLRIDEHIQVIASKTREGVCEGLVGLVHSFGWPVVEV